MPDDAGVSNLIRATEALAAGELTRRGLAREYTKLYRNVYAPRGVELTAADLARAAWMWSGGTATVAGLSAAALLGSRWVPADAPAELVRTHHDAAPGIVVYQDRIADDEIRLIGGIACTTVPRTAFDLGRRLPLEQGVMRIDALLNATGVPVADLQALAAGYPGARNIRRLRQVLELADGGAESPQESRLRLVFAGCDRLPPIVTQIPVRNAAGRVVRRVDMGWPQWQVGVEYDGAQHWTDPENHASDIDRLEFLAGLGWRIIRVSARHLRGDRPGILRRTEEALRAAGWSA